MKQVVITLSCYGKYRVTEVSEKKHFINCDMYIKDFEYLESALDFCKENDLEVTYIEK